MSQTGDIPKHDESFCPTCERSYPASDVVCEVDGARLVPLSTRDPLLGTVLDGRFEIVDRLGSGGMGAVYVGRQTSVDRPVAIKVMQSRFGNDVDITRRFIREAKLASKLNHPNSVAVIDFGQSSERLLYLVMELVNGRTLAELVREEGPQPIHRVVEIGLQVASALAAAHDCGIVHRDLKPTNIMIEERQDGDLVKVLDFGVAKNLNNDGTQLTQTDAVVGTPTYMSPEAVRGLATDGRSDLYALGLILYELLNGYPPFVEQLAENQGMETVDGDPASQPLLLLRDMALKLAYCHAEVEPTPLGDHIPAPLTGIVMRLLRKQPADRFQDATQLKEALVAFSRSLKSTGAFPRVSTVPPVARVGSQPSLAEGMREAGTAPTALAVPVQTARPSSGRAASAPLVQPSTSPVASPRRAWLVRVIAVGAAIGIGIGLVALTQKKGSNQAVQPAVKQGKPSAEEQSPPVKKAPAVSPPAVEDEGKEETRRPRDEIRLMERPEAQKPVSRLVMWRLAATPQAEVWVEGEMIGTTPILYEVEIGDDAIELEFRKEGYETVVESLVPTQGSRGISVTLNKEATKKRRPSSSGKRRQPKQPPKKPNSRKRAGDGAVDPFAN